MITKNKHSRVVSVVITCLLIVVFWEVMSNMSRRPLDGFSITSEDFLNFNIHSDAWDVRKLPVETSRLEPNLLALELSPSLPALLLSDSQNIAVKLSPVLVRLTHGYNMPDCMKIKGYKVEYIGGGYRSFDAQHSTINAQVKEKDSEGWGGYEISEMCEMELGDAVQIWRIVSPTGDISIWVTSVLRVGDFCVTGVDIRRMAFPRIGTPDDPRWVPQGLRWKSFSHPLRNFGWFLRAKWNNSRSDIWTFLKLKQPAWVDATELTLVSAWKGLPINSGEAAAIKNVLIAHECVIKSLQNSKDIKPITPH